MSRKQTNLMLYLEFQYPLVKLLLRLAIPHFKDPERCNCAAHKQARTNSTFNIKYTAAETSNVRIKNRLLGERRMW